MLIVFVGYPCVSIQIDIGRVILQHRSRNTAGDEAPQIQTPEKLFFVRPLGQGVLELLHSGEPPAEPIHHIALGLSCTTQDEKVLPGQQGDGDVPDQLGTLGDLLIDFVHNGLHFVTQHKLFSFILRFC